MIKVYTGPMFSGKSLGLFYAHISNKKEGIDNILCFKPSKDTREISSIKSRATKEELRAIVISDLSEISQYITDETDTIIIDEVQFMSGDVQELLWLTLEYNINIYIAGLDMTSEQTPFGLMPNILAIADEIHKGKSMCMDCGQPAPYTYCKVEKDGEVLVGDKEEYIPLCGKCLIKRRKLDNEKRRSI